MSDKYILNEEGNPVPEPDLMKWGAWMQNHARMVKRETIGDSEVSTVFLGLDHAFGGEVPVLWETMVFGGKLDQEQERCGGKRSEALLMHEAMAKMVRESQSTEPPTK